MFLISLLKLRVLNEEMATLTLVNLDQNKYKIWVLLSDIIWEIVSIFTTGKNLRTFVSTDWTELFWFLSLSLFNLFLAFCDAYFV